MKKRLRILLLSTLLNLAVYSQLQVKNYFSFTGKKDVAVNAISQDYTGFLWLGTNDGVYKFDGKRAEEVSKDHKALKQNISAIFVDITDKAWIGTKQGKVYSVFNKHLDSLNFSSIPNTERITSICQLDSAIIIGTYGNGIYISVNGKISHYDTNTGLSDNVIYHLETDGKSRVWAGTDAGISELSGIFSKLTIRVISNKNGLPDNIVRNIAFENETLLISMQDSGACYFNLSKNRFQNKIVKGNWNMGTVIHSSTSGKNKITIGTEKSGIIEIVGGDTRYYGYPESIQTPIANQVFIDNTRQIWVASKKGLSQFTEKRFNLMPHIEGLTDDKILAITTDNTNGIWVGTNNGIAKLENGPGSSMAMGGVPELSKFTISCATKAPNGDIWFGSYGNGLIVLNPVSKKIRILNSTNSNLTNDNISHIYFDTGKAYISTLGGGLIIAKSEIINNKELTILKTLTESDGLGTSYVYQSLTDKNGRLFVATDGGGLQVYDNNRFIDLSKKHKLQSSTVFSLAKDKYNTIWAVSNADGILKYSGNNLISISTSAGLRDVEPQQILAVDNTLYAFNTKGIDKINCVSNQVTYYDLFETDLDPNLNAICYDNGKIISGTNNGLLVYRTERSMTDSVKPTAYIKELQVNNKIYPIDSLHEFKYKQNNFSISFDGVWLKAPNKLSFRYRLNGLEENWRYSNEGEIVHYNNLPSGEYTFILQSANEEDIWSEPVGYYFIILTPIWKRVWFWIVLIIALTAGIYLLFRYRIRALKRKNELLEQRVAERTQEIEKQSKIIELKNIELEQLSLVASKTDNVVLILDANGKLEYVNESFIRLNHMNAAELVKNYGETIYDFSNNPNIRELINEAITNKRSVHYESVNTKIESEFEIWESSTLTPIFGEDSVLRKIIIIDTDVSEIKKQERVITQKNKDITDSISYARKIQHSILPRDQVIKANLPQSFILYLTKDIVSGDFYWYAYFNEFSIIAAVDCTGHGVPGAFMSLIGYSLLNRIINEKKITDPAEILLELNEGVLGILHKNESESKDGMDIAICKINHNTKTIEYAGAMRPLWIVRAGELTEIKADKIPIGTKQKDREETIAYNTRTIEVKQGDSFYIFTDGYADQFGGPKDKKFSTGKFKDLLIQNAELAFDTQEKNIKQEHLNWRHINEQVDDILVIGFSI